MNAKIRRFLWLLVPAVLLASAGTLAGAISHNLLAYVLLWGLCGVIVPQAIFVVRKSDDLRANRRAQRIADLEREAGLRFGEDGLLLDGYHYDSVTQFDKNWPPPKKRYKPPPRENSFTPLPRNDLAANIKASQRIIAAEAARFDQSEQESLASTRRALQDCHHVWSPIEHTCVKCGAPVHSILALDETILSHPQLVQIDRVEEALRALHGKWPKS